MKVLRMTLILLMIFSIQSLFGQYFGKNKVQYTSFKWRYIQSEHFDIYFYEGGKKIAEFTAETAEEAYKQISRDWNYQIRDRIVFIVYKSHNDWQQTNVVIDYLEEGIGGVTELFKNRIVVPFEGSYEQFRHVIHHELTHAVMNDMLYGGNVQSLIMGEVMPPPLWFSEGLAEFQSEGWTTQIDMIVRDAVLNGTLPPLQYLEYYLVYQGGASVFKYIANTYGRSKVAELLGKLRGRTTFEKALRSAVGMGYEEFTEKWHRELKKQYWPDIADRKVPSEFSKQLTNHEKIPNFMNVSPAISPNGDKIAFISDQKGYQNIYLMQAIDGKIIKTLVKGQRSESFEELHFLRPGMSFSPDGKKIVFSAKSGQWDAIYIVNVKNSKIKKYTLKMDGVFTTAWSPDGNRIAFIGNKDGQSDLYVYDLSTKKLTQLTSDVFTDDHPSWSADGKRIAFVSDRKDYVDDSQIPDDFKISEFDYAKRDIYIIDVDSKKIERITNTPWEEANPIFSPDGNKIAFTSDKNGIFNIYFHDLEMGYEYPITNVITGIFQINWDKNANKLVYTTFYKAGYDIYILSNPLDLQPIELKNTIFAKEMQSDSIPMYAVNYVPPKEPEKEKEEIQNEEKIQGNAPADYSRFIFDRDRPRPSEKKKDVTLPDNVYQNDEGEYKVRKYKLKFSPDIITGNAGYNTFFGIQGFTTLAFSDLLGDHKIYMNINLFSDIKNSDLNLIYFYLKHRINYGFGGYHLAYFFYDNFWGLIRYRNFGTNFVMSYPLNKFSRFDLSLVWYNVYLEYLDYPLPTEKVSTFLPTLSYVHDTALWGYTGPVDGSRYSIDFTVSPKYDNTSVDFRTVRLDYRKYFMLNRDYQFAFRLAGGASFGKNAQRFFLGGIDNWINRKFNTSDNRPRIENIEDVFFSEFITPLRGSIYYDREGDTYFLSNLEFRFPMIEYLGLGFPKIRFFNIRGVMFYDIGTAFFRGDNWTDFSTFKGTTRNQNGDVVFKDLISGFGTGARIFFLYFLMRIDVAWNFNLHDVGKPIWYISLGADL